MDFDPRFASSFGQGEEEDMPPLEVVRHPFAPPHLPFAIQDNINGGFLTGTSPHYPQLFATVPEAHAAMLDHIQSSQSLPAFSPFGRSSSPFGSSSTPFGSSSPFGSSGPSSRATASLPSRGAVDRFGRTMPPPSAMPAPSGNQFGAQGLGPRTSFAVNQSPNPGATRLGPATAGGLQLASNKKPTVPIPPTVNPSNSSTNGKTNSAASSTKATPLPPNYYSSWRDRFVSALVPNTKQARNNAMSYMNSSQIATFRALQLGADQETLVQIKNNIRANPGAATPGSKLATSKTFYEAKVAWDRLLGTMPGNDPGLWNCAVGAQQFLYAYGLTWDQIPHTESAGMMRSIVASRPTWKNVSYGDLKPGDLIFIPEKPQYDKHGKRLGSGWHVCVFVGPDNTAIQADSGHNKNVKNYMRLVKYLPFPTKSKYGEVEYYHFTGPVGDTHNVNQKAPWKDAKGNDRGNWKEYSQDSLPATSSHGHHGGVHSHHR